MLSKQVLSRFTALLLLQTVLAACGGGGGTAPPVTGAPSPIAVQRAFAALTFTAPVALLQAPNDATRWYVVEQGGTVRAFANDPAVADAALVLDIRARVSSGGETGLLGMAFHPNFPADPRVFLSYTAGSAPLQSRLSEFRSADGGVSIDPASEKVLLSIDQPAANHNGGNIMFGPDGFLYAGFGDGGGAGDPWGSTGNGQNLMTLLGKMLRIDVDTAAGAAAYGIPSTNPAAGNALCTGGGGAQACPEVFAFGLRNPWRWSFDKVSGELWVADVGQDSWEEVDKLVAGGNYGWRCREGAQAFNGACGAAQNLMDPVAEYDHTQGESITGGFVYRGTAIAALIGRFVVGDFVSGRIFSVARDATPTVQLAGGIETGLQIASFAQEANGELLLLDYAGGVYRLVPGGS